MSENRSEKQIRIFDTTLRDGEQAPGCSMTLNEKLRVAKSLAELNVDITVRLLKSDTSIIFTS